MSKYSIEIIGEIIEKIEKGEKFLTLSKEYGIPRGTIKYWYNTKDNIKADKRINIKDVDNKVYSYVLGLYLGDGCIDKMKKTQRLRIALDNRQDLVISETINNLKLLFPNNKISIQKFEKINKKYVIIYLSSSSLINLFPQYGKGRKHNRKIELTEEQKSIIDYNMLMKGLFHTDGSFFVATGKYPRYQFTNKSKDLINIFSDCLIRNGIQPKSRIRKTGIIDVQIQKKSDVMKLYSLLGEKYFEKKLNKN